AARSPPTFPTRRSSDLARKWLAEQAVDADDECLLRRVIGEDGRSRAFINGNNVPLQSLKELGEMLLDIHGQHFHQSLGRRSVQRDRKSTRLNSSHVKSR